jgi:hypothetical protein
MISLLLPPTLAWKLSVGAGNPNEFMERTLAFLMRSGYEVKIMDVMNGMQIMDAVKGDCRMFVADRSDPGWTRQLMESLGGDTSRNFTIFGGKVYRGEPTWRVMVNTIYFKNLRRLGLTRFQTMAEVAASPGCDADLLTWTGL